LARTAEDGADLSKLWFRARDYGWGWTPISVEGWLVMLAFVVAIAFGAWFYISRLRDGADPPTATILYLLWIAVSVAALIAVAWATGERPRWRWRW
jgi:thiol:disulfide interchange protein